MSNPSFVVSVPYLDDVKEAMREVKRKSRDVSVPMRAMGEQVLIPAIQEQFYSQGERFGTPWEPSKAAIKRGGLTLIDTRKLIEGFEYVQTGPSMFEIQNEVPYFPYHEQGTVRFPARPMMPDEIPEEDEERMVEILLAWLETPIEGL